MKIINSQENISCLQILFLLVIIFTGIFTRVNAFQTKKYFTPDEEIYLGYAQGHLNEGFTNSIRNSIKNYNSDAKLRMYPLPTRIGHTGLLSLELMFFGRHNHKTYLPLIYSVLSLVLVVCLTYYLLGIYGAYFSGLTYGLFLPSIDVARRVWAESLTEFLFISILISGLLIIKKQKVISYLSIPYILFGTYIFFVKESSLMILFLCSLPPFIYFLYLKKYSEALKMIMLGVLVIIAGISILVLFAGGLQPIIDTLANHKEAHINNPFAISVQGGDWTSFVQSLYIMSPGTVAIAVFYLVMPFYLKKLLQRVNKQNLVFAFLILFSILFVYTAVSSLAPYYKNFRLFAPIYPVIVIFITLPAVLLLNYLDSADKKNTFVLLNLFLLICLISNIPVMNKLITTVNCQDQTVRQLVFCKNFKN